MSPQENDGRLRRLGEIIGLFFKLGVCAFGGPVAHIAMMEEEVIHRRRWMSREYFLDLVGVTNLIPGPNSTEMAIHCGFHRAGWMGLITAGVSFILPAAVLTGALAYLYVRFGEVPEVSPFIGGIRPAVLAIILGAVIKLGKKALKDWRLGVVGAGVVAASLAGAYEIIVILCGAVAGMVWRAFVLRGNGELKLPTVAPLPLSLFKSAVKSWPAAVLPAATAYSLPVLFFIFLKIGAVLFGSGYVLIAYLEDELIGRLGWLTQRQLLDAVAFGQLTPGPVLTTATFIGYQVGGISGAVWATLGIFLPAFCLVAVVNPLVPRLRQSRWASLFLDAANISAVGLMVAVMIRLGITVLRDIPALVIMGLSVLAVFGPKKISSVWIVILASLAGYLLHLLGL